MPHSLIQLVVLFHHLPEIELHLYSQQPLQFAQLPLNFLQMRSSLLPLRLFVLRSHLCMVDRNIIVQEDRRLVVIWKQIFDLQLTGNLKISLSLVEHIL